MGFRCTVIQIIGKRGGRWQKGMLMICEDEGESKLLHLKNGDTPAPRENVA